MTEPLRLSPPAMGAERSSGATRRNGDGSRDCRRDRKRESTHRTSRAAASATTTASSRGPPRMLLLLSVVLAFVSPRRGPCAEASRSSPSSFFSSTTHNQRSRGATSSTQKSPHRRSRRRGDGRRRIWGDGRGNGNAHRCGNDSVDSCNGADYAFCLGKKIRTVAVLPRGGAADISVEDEDEYEYDEEGSSGDDEGVAQEEAKVSEDPEGGEAEDDGEGASEEEEDVAAGSTDKDEDGEGASAPVPSPSGASNDAEDETVAAEGGGDDDEDDGDVDPEDPSAAHRREARTLRTIGKELHDGGDLAGAASTFRRAADELDRASGLLLSEEPPQPEEGGGDASGDAYQRTRARAATLDELSDERATCVLHEALCRLKMGDHAGCVESCTDVLGDGVRVVPLDLEDGAMVDGESSAEEGEEAISETVTAAVVRVTTIPEEASSSRRSVSAAARARAYHRRAKARLALEDPSGALDDARSAAFLGDRNAVALYGKLMREHGGGDPSSEMGGLLGGDMSSAMEGLSGLFGSGGNPFLSGSGSGSGDNGGSSSSALLESLLKGAGDSGSASGAVGSGNPLGALGDLGSLLGAGGLNNGGKNGGGGGGLDSLAKSVLKNLSKRIDDESTQEQICNFLNRADSTTLRSYASMAGMDLPEAAADRIATFASGVTPRGIKKGVKWSKRAVRAANIMRKTAKVIGKYRHLLVLFVIVGWIKSAVLRPVKVGKKAARAAAKAAAKAAAATAATATVATASGTLDAAAAAVRGESAEATTGGGEAIEVTIDPAPAEKAI